MSELLKTPEIDYGLPTEVKFCTKCILSNQRPGTVVEIDHKRVSKKPTVIFDGEGVCSACRYAEIKKKIDWTDRERQLRELLDRYRRNDGRYDCVVPGSGGKDSAYVSHLLKYKYGMNPLTVTWSPHLYTDVGFRNMQHWIHSGFDNILFTPNGKVHALLTRLAFENLLHPFQPFIIGQKLVAPRVSVMYDIPLVMYGESGVEYGNNIEEANCPTMSLNFFAQKDDPMKLVLGGVPVKDLVRERRMSISDLNPYLPVDMDALKKVGTEVHFFSYYYNWDPQEHYYYAAEHVGYEANTERTDGSYSKYSSIDDKIDPFYYYTMLIKFGIGRATCDAAQEIRAGKITREEGVALVHKYDTEFPKKYFKDFLVYIGMNEKEFWGVIDRFRAPHLWKKENGEWKLRLQVS